MCCVIVLKQRFAATGDNFLLVQPHRKLQKCVPLLSHGKHMETIQVHLTRDANFLSCELNIYSSSPGRCLNNWCVFNLITVANAKVRA